MKRLRFGSTESSDFLAWQDVASPSFKTLIELFHLPTTTNKPESRMSPRGQVGCCCRESKVCAAVI